MKDAMRKEVKQARNGHHAAWGEKQSEEIAKRLMELPQFKKAKIVLLYASVGSEVMTQTLIEECFAAGKRVCLPVTRDEPKKLLACEISRGEKLEARIFGIPEPVTCREVNPTSIDFIVAPGIAFDRKGNRLGYGGGYYDSFLHQIGATKVGIAYSVQLVGKVPVKDTDVPVDLVITEKEVIDCQEEVRLQAANQHVQKIRIAVMASGRGSDFQSILDGVGRGAVRAEIVGLIVDNPDAYAIERAKAHGVPYFVLEEKKYGSREKLDEAIKEKLDGLKADLVVLAGYMKIIKGRELLEAYEGKMINIHPSLLPKYPGAHAQQDAFDAHEQISGFTIHFVDDSLDGGPIIYQEKVDISDCKSAQEVADKILAREHVGLPKIVDGFARGQYKYAKRK